MSELDNLENNDFPPLTLDYADSAGDYNLITYMGQSYSVTHPENLYSLGRLFGVQAKPMENMRVMEIGTAIGGNILPMAVRYPNAEFVGIEPAAKQLAIAEKRAAKIGAKNCRFYNVFANDIPKELGKFDYIICHGVFSWIDEEARDSIMRACQNHLAETGLALISYNCKPGWNFLSSMRDVMLFHTRNIRDPMLRVQQLRQSVNFIADNAVGSKIYNDYFKSHADTLKKRADYYLFHEYLAPVNHAFYFTEFMDVAQRHDLNYICEVSDHYDVDLSNFKPEVQQFLATVTDRVERSQYIDYLLNRQFRSTVLSLSECKLAGETQRQLYEELFYRPDYRFEETSDNGNKTLSIKNSRFTLAVRDKPLEALLKTLQASKEKALNIDAWVQETKAAHPDIASDDAELRNFLMSRLNILIYKGFLRFWPYQPRAINYIEDKPKVFEYVGRLAEDGKANGMSNYFGDGLPQFSKQIALLLPLLDGKHSISELRDFLKKAIFDGELLLPDKLTAQLLGQYSETAEIPRYSRFERQSVVKRMTDEQLTEIAANVTDTVLETLKSQSLLVR